MSNLATLEAALLSDDAEDLLCEVDKYTREITVPAGLAIAGVISDDDTHIIRIKVPRFVDNDCDLSTFNPYVNYMNGNGAVAAYPFRSNNMAVYSDHIILSWSLSRIAMAYKGVLRFSVCFRKVNSLNQIEQEWNSTIAEVAVLDGLEASEVDTEVLKRDLDELLLNASSIRNEMLTRINGKVDKETGKGLSTNDYTDADRARVQTLTDEYISNMMLSESGTNLLTLTAAGTQYANVYEWSDGNTSDEDRIGYFVTVDLDNSGIMMTKANSTSAVLGVTITAPGFAASAPVSKYDAAGSLLSKYDYVGFAGVVTVIDNGLCDVKARCMPGGDGTAIPSTNNLGYLVLDRVDSTHVRIQIEPSGDMMQRLLATVNTLSQRVDQYVAAGGSMESRTLLLSVSGQLGAQGSTVNLGYSIVNFDQVEIYYDAWGERGCQVFDVNRLMNIDPVISVSKLSQGTSGKQLDVAEMRLTFNAWNVTITSAQHWTWTGSDLTSATQTTQTGTTSSCSFGITKIIGVKHDNAELRDLRLGIDGTLYTSAGEAVRAHAQNLVALSDRIDTLQQAINAGTGSSAGAGLDYDVDEDNNLVTIKL